MLAGYPVFFDQDPEEVECTTYEVIQVIDSSTSDYRGIKCDDMDKYVLYDGDYIELYRFLDTHEVSNTELIESNLFYSYNDTPIYQELNIDLAQLSLIEVRDLRLDDGTTAITSDDPSITVLDIMYTTIKDNVEDILKNDIGFEMYFCTSVRCESYGPSSDVIFTFTDGDTDFFLHLREGTTVFIESNQEDEQTPFFSVTIAHNIQVTVEAFYAIVNVSNEKQ
jgi:hypothetical protein